MAASQKLADITVQEEEEQMYGHGPLTKEELEEKYPDRPHNHSLTLPFHELHQSLFNPLEDNKKKPSGAPKAKKGGNKKLSSQEIRRALIERFISRWRKEVGDDIYPAFRLIIPEKDRDRAMYGLKEKNIAKILIKVLGIDKDREDGKALLNWKTGPSTSAGDFAGRCFEVISKRHTRTHVGDMRIGEVNVLLDQLSAASKEIDQLPIFRTFFKRMNADELMWLIKIILRQMKIGATEKTFLNLWHPDGETLFNISSNLRRCCWELVDPSLRLGGQNEEDASVSLMECFQPQLAQFQMHDFNKMVDKLGRSTRETDSKSKKTDSQNAEEFWIEEKLDGERMQLHMVEDSSVEGGKRFAFWSRKAKDYTFLYGSGFFDENSSLTRHLRDAFDKDVGNIILDGEMITWDPATDKMLPFGTLKTAAISEQKNPFSTGPRPLFRVFDILFMNDKPLTKYQLRVRREVLDRCVNDVHRRLEKHTYEVAHDPLDIEPLLRKVVAEASEGLVLKNPLSAYRLNSRNDDWMKVKPEYMEEFGEELDCVIIGGYYGSGHRGGSISSFLCGLRIDEDIARTTNSNPELCKSFFKVGGGFRAEDYANIHHHCDGKWIDWDPKKPPTEYIELGGGVKRQFERPDVWIKPSDSVVISSKAASVAYTEQFAAGFTLRFPRFRKLRMDRSWDSALTLRGFEDLKNTVETEAKEKKFVVEKRHRAPKRLKRERLIAGNDEVVEYSGSSSELFAGLNFQIMSERTNAPKKSKAELEQMVKAHGGKFFQSTSTLAEDVICVADKRLVKVAALMKANRLNIVNSSWILDNIHQAEIDTGKPRLLLPFEPRHMFHTLEGSKQGVEDGVDVFGDSYARDVTVEDLRERLEDMDTPDEAGQGGSQILEALNEFDELREARGYMFRGCKVYMDFAIRVPLSDEDLTTEELRMKLSSNIVRFGGGDIITDFNDESATHIVVNLQRESEDARAFRNLVSGRERLPRIVTVEWIEDSWAEKTLLDGERFMPL